MKFIATFIVAALLLMPVVTSSSQKAQWDKSSYQEKTTSDQKKATKPEVRSKKGKNSGNNYSPEIIAQKAQWVKSLDQDKVTDEMKDWIKDFELSGKGKDSDGDLQKAKIESDAILPVSFSAIFKNNIFDPNRRPGGTAAKKIVKKAPPKVIFMELTGVLIFGDGAVAFFEGSSPLYSGPREKGDEIAGLTLTNVQTDQVTLAKNDFETLLPVGSRFGTWGDGEWSVMLAPYRPLDRMPLMSLAAAKSKKGQKDTKGGDWKKQVEDWVAMSSGEKLAIYQKKADAYMNSEKGWGTKVQFQQMGDQMVKMVQQAGSGYWSLNMFDPNLPVEK